MSVLVLAHTVTLCIACGVSQYNARADNQICKTEWRNYSKAENFTLSLIGEAAVASVLFGEIYHTWAKKLRWDGADPGYDIIYRDTNGKRWFIQVKAARAPRELMIKPYERSKANIFLLTQVDLANAEVQIVGWVHSIDVDMLGVEESRRGNDKSVNVEREDLRPFDMNGGAPFFVPERPTKAA